jgi:hypothetical protein
MISDIYKIDGKYPDPHQIEAKLDLLKNTSGEEIKYKKSLKEVRQSGLSTHPLLRRFFVES